MAPVALQNHLNLLTKTGNTRPVLTASPASNRVTRRSVVFRAAAADKSATDTSGSFDSGAGKVGTVSTTRPSTESVSTTSTTGRPPASSETIKEAQNNAKLFLTGELSRLFDYGSLTKEKYASDFSFQDPIAKYSGIDAFQASLAVLKRLFKIDFTLHSIGVSGDTEITTRWSMELTPRFTPWVQRLVFTGRSFYTIDVLSGGKITSQRDVWDAVSDNSFLSLEGIVHLLSQVRSGQTSPRLKSPKYTVWKKTKEYEIRQYAPYLSAEVSMPSTASITSSTGFDDLASYIFGGNQREQSLGMTTPVISSSGQGTSGSMEFPIAAEGAEEPTDLPIPDNARVKRTKQEGATVAVASVSGWPLNFQVREVERKLRGVLLLDGLKPSEGYKLARYNDPFTPPFLRRNEVIIKLDDYQLESVANN